MPDDPFADRYLRQLRVRGFGPEGQQALRRARVAVVGVGALGSRVAEDLARAGVGYLRLIDRDFVEPSNLHRQHLFDEDDARGEAPKALAAASRIARLNGDVEVAPELRDLDATNAEELLLDVDLWLDGTDNFQTRYLLNDLAVRERRSWVYGACVGTQAMAAAFVAGRSCLRCLFPEPPPAGSTETCETAGILPPAAALATALQGALALALLTRPGEPPAPRLYMADVADLEPRAMRLPERPVQGCAVCEGRAYPALELEAQSSAKALCGRNAVQLSAPAAGFPELGALAAQLERGLASQGADGFAVERHAFMLRLHVPEGRITVFPGGRAIVQGTDDPGRARALFDRYIGS
ncbi:MAG: ThiF family adenylyltransferase [Planctomycetota bacterium]